MFNITRSDIAWGTGIASVIFAGGFFLILSSLVNNTAGAIGTGIRVQQHVAQGIADTSYWLRTPKEIAQSDAKTVMLTVVK